MDQSQFSDHLYCSVMMDKDRSQVNEKILNLTLEIICLLTGEDCVIVKKRSDHDTGISRIQNPNMVHPPMKSTRKEKKNTRMCPPPTAEVPVQAEDVAVFLSLEGLEYLEEHKDQCKDVMMENPRPLGSVGCDNITPELINLDDSNSEMSANDDQDPEEEPIHPDTISGPECALDNVRVTQNEEAKLDSDHSSRETLRTPETVLNMDLTSHGILYPTSSLAEKSSTLKKYRKRNTRQEISVAHLKIGRREKPCQCPDCGKYFTRASNLAVHQKLHTGEKPFACPECEKSFTDNSSLVAHLRIHTGEKPFVCSTCGKSYTRSSSLVVHQRAHTGEKPFVCPHCGKSFSKTSSLVAHQRIHTGEKPFVCCECGKSFTTTSNLLTHQRTHTGEKPFICSDCGKSFITTSSLISHQRIHTGEKPFICPDCGKCFSTTSNLVTHQTIHTGIKRFSCSWCEESFNQISNLHRHQKLHVKKPFSCA